MTPTPFSSSSPAHPTHDALLSNFAGVLSFMAVVAERSFVKAGHRLGMSRSAISRSVQRLETQLHTRLLQRSTRSVSLTGEGEIFYASCRPGVELITHAFQQMNELRDGPARGQLRVCSTIGFGRKIVGPLLPDFYRLHPEVEVELILDDRMTDFSADRIDISFRNGRLEDSSIVARQLAPMRMLVCASPAYAARHGLPKTIDEIERHACIQFRLGSGRLYEWEFAEKVPGRRKPAEYRLRKFLPEGGRIYGDPELVIAAVRDGLGIAQVASYQAADDLRAGRLVSCLEDSSPRGRAHYICYPSRQHMPARMRVFIDFCLERIGRMDLGTALEVD